MLIQGHRGLCLHIFHEMKYFCQLSSRIETLLFSNLYIDRKIWCLEDPLREREREREREGERMNEWKGYKCRYYIIKDTHKSFRFLY